MHALTSLRDNVRIISWLFEIPGVDAGEKAMQKKAVPSLLFSDFSPFVKSEEQCPIYEFDDARLMTYD